MFNTADRERLRDTLIAAAEHDGGVVGAALVGSAATGREDAWSDIDLMLQIEGDPDAVAERWTARFYAEHGAVHHLDVIADGVLYRVFLLDSSLQVDVSFWPRDRFRATEPGFKLLFGTPNPPTEPRAPDRTHMTGMGWLYALHARSAIKRDRHWQAAMMLDHLRDTVLALACARFGLNPHHGREAHKLPPEILAALAAARAASVDREELTRSNTALLECFAAEVAAHDPALARRLQPALGNLRL
ncbi:nucleotidyltransferase domain-containing protein [Glycomyces tritici]|uniref:Nucleotidyltransferase domain-containing protein n=1 Tax=Glycomyces tritici TaxID=2665176 RepID=A0ABT7YQ93_9ACTN|nr:nucleotidyltransferase domain-containing protein [Glycomyces tritici]MDN3240822.1 nucleotidyltransferase domain-containing protein [Glycomyces tritici]